MQDDHGSQFERRSTGVAGGLSAAVERGAWFPLRRTLVKVRGRDRIPFLHNLCTADVRRLQPGSGCEAFFLNVKGQVVAAAQLFVEEHQLVLESSDGLGENLVRHLEFYRIREDVQFEDATDALTASLLSDPLGRQGAAAWGLEWNSPMDHGLVRVGGVPVALRRNDAVGPPGVECVVARADRPALEQFLSEQGIARLRRKLGRRCGSSGECRGRRNSTKKPCRRRSPVTSGPSRSPRGATSGKRPSRGSTRWGTSIGG